MSADLRYSICPASDRLTANKTLPRIARKGDEAFSRCSRTALRVRLSGINPALAFHVRFNRDHAVCLAISTVEQEFEVSRALRRETSHGEDPTGFAADQQALFSR